MITIQALLFDLDGTLVDSVADIRAAVNRALESLERPPVSRERLVPLLGRGAAPVFAALLDAAPEGAHVDLAVNRFLNYYQQHTLVHTRPRDGVPQMLSHFAAVPKIVVSNKHVFLVRRVLAGLGLDAAFVAIYGGDSFPLKKPDPLPLLEAIKPYGWNPSRVVMVGDSPMDIIAGRKAGLKTCGVLGGLSTEGEIAVARPDVLLNSMLELVSRYRPVSSSAVAQPGAGRPAS